MSYVNAAGASESPLLVLGRSKFLRLDQMIGIIVKYMDEHPEETNEPFVTIIYKAIKQAWPCKK
jgi:Rap1a immunity proteins